MIYNKYSVVGFMLWLRYCLLTLNLFMSFDDVYSRYLESPGTKAFTRKQTRQLFSDFTYVSIETPLCHADLLESGVGQRHRGFFLSLARIIWPRFLIRHFFRNNGLTMLVTAYK